MIRSSAGQADPQQRGPLPGVGPLVPAAADGSVRTQPGVASRSSPLPWTDAPIRWSNTTRSGMRRG